jgi:hypothetical protein
VINANSNYGGNDGWSNYAWKEQTSSSGISEIVEYEVQPREFSRLRTGGAANRGEVDAIVFKNGAGFKATGRNWMKVTFKQDFRN